MQKFKILMLSVALFSVATTFSSCKKEDKKETSTNEAIKATAVAYDCPMKCEGAKSDKPGKCPVCKMDLVEVK